jgi:Helix-turn-helix domain
LALRSKDVDILWVLLTINRTHKTGFCFPSYATIADRAGCDPSAVGRGLPRLKAAGVLDWVNCTRIANVDGRRRFLRSSNAYTFIVPVEKSSKAQVASGPASRGRLNLLTRTFSVPDGAFNADFDRSYDDEPPDRR